MSDIVVIILGLCGVGLTFLLRHLIFKRWKKSRHEGCDRDLEMLKRMRADVFGTEE